MNPAQWRAMPVMQRIMCRVDQSAGPSGCWPWLGCINDSGYGRVGYKGDSNVPAHRVVYDLLVGSAPVGLDFDHRCHTDDLSCSGGPACRHRRCCNPAHLEPVTRRENLARARSFSTINAAKTHCAQGHAFTPENTRICRRRGGTFRQCRTCSDGWKRAYRERRRDLPMSADKSRCVDCAKNARGVTA